jgi:hypothetical protein
MNNILRISEFIVFGSLALYIIYKVLFFIVECILAIKEGFQEGFQDVLDKNGVSSYKELKEKIRKSNGTDI